MFQCPRCKQLLGEPSPTGVLEVVCASCSYSYYILTGELTSKTSREVTVTGLTSEAAAAYRREYELHLSLPDDRMMAVPFRIAGRDDSLMLQRGHRVSVVATIKDKATQDIVQVIDHTTGADYRISDPGAQAGRKAWLVAFVVALGTMVIAAPTLGGWSLFLALAAAGAAYIGVKQAFAPTRRLDAAESQHLLQSQALLARKSSILEERGAIETEMRDRRALRERLIRLHRKMTDVGREMYGSRIDTITRAVDLLDQQLDVDRQLLDSYNRTVGMVDIEIESGETVGTMPDDAALVLEEKRQELADLRERHADLTRQIAANEEVERALRA